MIGVCHNEKFSDLNDHGQEILNLFDTIKPKLNEVLELVEEIKFEMLKRTILENQDKLVVDHFL